MTALVTRKAAALLDEIIASRAPQRQQRDTEIGQRRWESLVNSSGG
jgi:hypothetical protein